MTKPKAIRWLEDETGQTLDYPPTRPATGQDRHLSVRIDASLGSELDALAARRGTRVSQLVRELLLEAVVKDQNTSAMDTCDLLDRAASDIGEVQRRMAR